MLFFKKKLKLGHTFEERCKASFPPLFVVASNGIKAVGLWGLACPLVRGPGLLTVLSITCT